MLVFLDRQHAGKPKRLSDRGAGQDLDGDGVISWEEKEAIWTGKLSIELEILLLGLGYDVMTISDGDYRERHNRVNQYSYGIQESIYLALHLNSGGGKYGSFFYHHSSTKGRELSKQMAKSLYDQIEISDTKAIPCASGDWTKNAWNTIKGVGRPVAICCEPIFMDTHKHFLTDEGIKLIALGMASGIQSWVEK